MATESGTVQTEYGPISYELLVCDHCGDKGLAATVRDAILVAQFGAHNATLKQPEPLKWQFCTLRCALLHVAEYEGVTVSETPV